MSSYASKEKRENLPPRKKGGREGDKEERKKTMTERREGTISYQVILKSLSHKLLTLKIGN